MTHAFVPQRGQWVGSILALFLAGSAFHTQAQTITVQQRTQMLAEIDAMEAGIQREGNKFPSVKAVPEWQAAIDQSLFSVMRDLGPMRNTLEDIKNYQSIRDLVLQYTTQGKQIIEQRLALEKVVAAADFKRFQDLGARATAAKLQSFSALQQRIAICQPNSNVVTALQHATVGTINLGTAQALQAQWQACNGFASDMVEIGKAVADHKASLDEAARLLQSTPRLTRFPQATGWPERLRGEYGTMGRLGSISATLQDYTAEARKAQDWLIRDVQGLAARATQLQAVVQSADKHSVTVLNLSKLPVKVFWLGAGCTKAYEGQHTIFSTWCHVQDIAPGDFANRRYPTVATAMRLIAAFPGCQGATYVGQTQSGADLHVLSGPCSVQPESAKLSEADITAVRTIHNHSSEVADVYFRANAQGGVGCVSLMDNEWDVCFRVRLNPGETASYPYHGSPGLDGKGLGYGVRGINRSYSFQQRMSQKNFGSALQRSFGNDDL